MDAEEEEIPEDTQEEEDLDAVEEAEYIVEEVTPDQDPVTPYSSIHQEQFKP